METAWLTDTVTTDLDRAIHYTLLWGLEALELRMVGGEAERVPFINEAKLRRRLDEHELTVTAIVPGLFEGFASDRVAWLNEVVQLAETLAFCKRIGCQRIVASGFAAEDDVSLDDAAAALRKAGEAAARHGITVAVLNEFGMAHETGAQLAALLAATNHPAVRAAWNPADAVKAGESAADGLAAVIDRVDLVRCRDGSEQSGVWDELLLGEGDINWPDQLRSLKSVGFDGPFSLEILIDPRPKQGLRMATALIHLGR